MNRSRKYVLFSKEKGTPCIFDKILFINDLPYYDAYDRKTKKQIIKEQYKNNNSLHMLEKKESLLQNHSQIQIHIKQKQEHLKATKNKRRKRKEERKNGKKKQILFKWYQLNCPGVVKNMWGKWLERSRQV
jgi:hypothetical protein